MNDIVKNILISIGGGFLLYQLQVILCSDYLIVFLEDNLVSLLIAVMAINSASLGIVLSKIREILDSVDGNHGFLDTKNEMLLSIKEQMVLIFLSLFLMILNASELIIKYSQLVFLIKVLIISCFIYAMQILYDTAKSIFVILSFNANMRK